MNTLYPMHLGFMIAAFSAFTMGFITALLFLFQEDALKSHRPAVLGRRLPALETIHAFHYKILTLGFVLLSLGMLVGAILSKMRIGRFFSGDPREMGALIIWALYALFLNVRLSIGWRGKKGILLSLLGFVGVILTFLGLGHRM